MNHVRKLDGILDEEHRDVVADDIPVAFFGIDLYGKAADVARQIGRAFVTSHRRETHEQRRFLSCSLKQVGFGDVGQRFVVLEIAMRSETTGMNHPFGDTLMVEVEELLAQVKILERGRPARSNLEGILVIRYRNSLLCRQYRSLAIGDLVRFSPSADRHILI